MNSPLELTTARFVTTPSDEEVLAATTANSANRTPASSWKIAAGVVAAAFVAMIAGTAGIALLRSGDKPRDNSPLTANMFLWAIGSDLTWEQYQAEQRSRGRERLNEDEYDWSQQALNDAYIGDWDPDE